MGRLLVSLGFVCGLALCARPAAAAEQSEAFLDGLRERGFFDTAVDFLELARNSPLADKDFRETIDCQLAILLVEGAWLRALPSKDQESHFTEASNWFRKFLAEYPQHRLADTANTRLAELLAKLGKLKIGEGEQAGKTAEQKTQLVESARDLFLESRALFSVASVRLGEKLKAFGSGDKTDADRAQTEEEIVYTRLSMAVLTFDIAMTREPGSDERKSKLATAVDELTDIDDKYSPALGAYHARIYRARCYKELGSFDKALELLDNLVEMGSDPEPLSRMRSKAAALAIEIALMPQSKKYKEAMNVYERWEKGNSPQSASSQEALPVKCLAGEAALERARELRTDSPSEAIYRKDLIQRAADLLTAAARVPSEYQHRAAVKLADPLLAAHRVQEPEPRSYEEARERGRRAWDQMQVPGLKSDEQVRLREEGVRCFRFALGHLPLTTNLEDLNFMRNCLAFLYWDGENPHEAAVLGEFLARRYPDWPRAQSAAKIALSAYAKMYAAPLDGDRQVENDGMMRMAELIVNRWPNTTAADDAWVTVARATAGIRQLQRAKEYLGRVAVSSSRRGEAEVLVGRALWKAYVDAARLPKKQRPPKSDMTTILAQSQEWIETGVERMKQAGADVNDNLAAATYALAQICLEKGQPDKAVQWLDDPKFGAHTLLRHPVTDQGSFRIDALKLTLQAYVAAQRWEAVEPLLGTLEEMGRDIALAPIYVGLGQQIEKSLKRFRDVGDAAQADKAAPVLDLVLTRIAGRPDSEVNFDSLRWTANALSNLADRVDRGVKTNVEAAGYYSKAVAVYEKIRKMSLADEKFTPDPLATTEIEIGLARCYRRLGEFHAAIAILVKILRTQTNLMAAQREAALVYQAWGEEKASNFLLAITGANRIELSDGSDFTVVWGWGQISKRALSGRGNEGLFFEARYCLAFCRFRYALTRANPQRNNLLKEAERDVLVVLRQYPEMGGKAWYDQYDGLLKRIQNALGVKEDGLKGADQRIVNEIEKANEPPAASLNENE